MVKTYRKKEYLNIIRNHNILLTIWNSMPVPPEIVNSPGNLQYICNISGELKRWIPIEIIESDIPVTNWGNAPANGVAEGTVTLLLAVLKDLHAHIQNVRKNNWKLHKKKFVGGTIQGLNLGLYGFGAIGHRFAEMMRVFNPKLRVYDPYVNDFPEYCQQVESLRELFQISEAVTIHAGLTEETKGSVTAELLSLLPDNGIIINTARGAIIDQEALFEELSKGRIRAGLDVLEGKDCLPSGHPARKWNNCIFSCHEISKETWPQKSDSLQNYHHVCLDNLSRFINGKPLRFLIDREKYLKTT